MELKSSPKIFKNYKSDHPKNTLKRIKDGLNKIGLKLEYVEKKIESKGHTIYSGDLFLTDFGFRTTGKANTRILAECSAYAEMVERLSAGLNVFNNLNHNIEKYSDILDDFIKRKFINGFTIEKDSKYTNYEQVNKYLQNTLSNEQYKTLEENNIFNFLVDSTSIITGKTTKVPIHFIDMVSGSNGLAAGNTYEEAVFQGSCEIFERYASSEIITKKITCPTIDINSISDKRIEKFVEMLNSINIEVIIKDFTLNNKIPVVGVLFINKNIENDENQLKKDRYYKLIDPGSHLDLEEAIVRCFTERVQSLTTDELMYRKDSDILYNFWVKKLGKKYLKNKDKYRYFFRNFYYYGDLSFLEKGKSISIDNLKNIKNDDFKDDIDYIKDNICKKNNWDLEVINCTHKTINFPAVRVIIPPISSLSNPYIRSFLDCNTLEEQFEHFYRIKNFYDYAYDDSWIDDETKIKKLIKNIEKVLSEDLYSFEFFIQRGPFYQCINLFHILAFLNISIGNYEESLEYLEFLQRACKNQLFKMKYCNEMYNPYLNPNLYEKYIKKIKQGKNKELAKFKLEKNPFREGENPKLNDKKISNLVKRLNDSYF